MAQLLYSVRVVFDEQRLHLCLCLLLALVLAQCSKSITRGAMEQSVLTCFVIFALFTKLVCQTESREDTHLPRIQNGSLDGA